MLPSASAPREGCWEAGDREASPPLDLCQDFSLPAPSSPPGSAPPRPLAPRPAAGSRPRPAAVPGPPPHPAPSPGAQERLSAGVPGFAVLWPRSKVRKTPGFPLREPESGDFLFTLLYEPLIQVSPRQPDPEAAAATTSSFSGGGGNHRSAGRPPARGRSRRGTGPHRRAPSAALGRPVTQPLVGDRAARPTHQPARPGPLPGHWSAVTGLTLLHRHLPAGGRPPAGLEAQGSEPGRGCPRWSPAPTAAASRSVEPPPTHAPLSRERCVPPASGGSRVLPRSRYRAEGGRVPPANDGHGETPPARPDLAGPAPAPCGFGHGARDTPLRPPGVVVSLRCSFAAGGGTVSPWTTSPSMPSEPCWRGGARPG
ncbi:PREDICTED: translation initiation factor IF-2-like [Sturnus vulgaris]|uniref:translation initiation factor IF-2-like n=1 Tax=Sturnus vulgaris TaxID=9172 RepID=UPI000719F95E|nr:PREDICTED: translation initiation factor IF-2-like [Sturnus vulgaris]